ncbi:MAG TPA: carboxymuconolactone decarboxylase family protein [Paraburkholderia sp.]|nr:carboxymuconolactone decarboxylase family protein [Paraburkholderia sp.]HTR05306.1 carboxymuconolactone decarboxylase family protein [Paraburkholderia sp.]
MESLDHASSVNLLAGMDTVSPALERYTNDVVLGNLWKRPQLCARDRSIVTLSVLIARNQSTELPFYLDLALDSGLQPSEISEIITHLAFYSGWPTATAAVKVTSAVFERRGMTVTQLPPAAVELLPVDKAAEAQHESTGPQRPVPPYAGSQRQPGRGHARPDTDRKCRRPACHNAAQILGIQLLRDQLGYCKVAR